MPQLLTQASNSYKTTDKIIINFNFNYKIDKTHRDGLDDDVRVAVVQPLHDVLEALLRAGGTVRHLVAHLHDQAPFLLCVVFVGRFFCGLKVEFD